MCTPSATSVVHPKAQTRSNVVAVRMSKSRTSIIEEPNYVMDETELLAYRQKGGPVDTANQPVQYYGDRGTLAGHI